ncbi:hypothetical protein H9L39_20151 [Fusarium oxysporum f. sp. albedinis]|nr:hypothetical protein H9L39_20151 [Fusarium oxysporum f. sp. albedinis]
MIVDDNNRHFGAEMMSRELAGLSVSDLSHCISKYIHGCKTCCLGQPNCQQSVGESTAVGPPPPPMHTIN